MRSSVLLVLAACGHDGIVTNSPDALIEAPAKTLVTIEMPVPSPQLFTYRDGHGPWQTPTLVSVNHWQLQVTNAYEVAVACATPAFADVEMFAATVLDPPPFVTCSVFEGTAATIVNGVVAQPGTIYLDGQQATGTVPNWGYDLSVPTGMHDLVGIGTDKRTVVRRGVQIVNTTTLATLDTSQGAVLTTVPLTIANAGSDSLDVTYYVQLAHDWLYLDSTSPPTVDVFPPALLDPHDVQQLFVTASTSATSRWASTTFTGTETAFTLMPPLTGVALAGAIATWDALPPYTDLWLDVMATAAGRRLGMRATKRWIEATGATRLDAAGMLPPGTDPGWNPTGVEYTSTFEVSEQSPKAISYGSSVNQRFGF